MHDKTADSTHPHCLPSLHDPDADMLLTTLPIDSRLPSLDLLMQWSSLLALEPKQAWAVP